MSSMVAETLVLDAAGIADLTAAPAGDDLSAKLLWRSGESASGVMHARAGAELGAHVHPDIAHHMWIMEGSCQVLGQEVGPGGYVHVPAGTEHAISVGPWGCTFFFVYTQEPTAPPRPM
jgi:mannose-6-phosphate isomerase-like protein (cupin superfamily)